MRSMDRASAHWSRRQHGLDRVGGGSIREHHLDHAVLEALLQLPACAAEDPQHLWLSGSTVAVNPVMPWSRRSARCSSMTVLRPACGVALVDEEGDLGQVGRSPLRS
jgi:hypothetical protein